MKKYIWIIAIIVVAGVAYYVWKKRQTATV